MISLLAAALLAPAPLQDDEAKNSWTIRADVIYTAAGDPIENGLIRVQDGKIGAVAKAGSGELRVAAVTPGMVDLGARLVTAWNAVEQSREVTPDLRVTEAVDLFSYRWERELRSGVTSVLVTPPDENVIGGLSAVLKTGGEPLLEARLVKADAALRGAIGAQPRFRNSPGSSFPTTFYARRPTTRMGVEWEHRRAFWDAKNATDAEGSDPGRDVLQSVLRGDLPFVVQAWATQDIRTAMYLKEEFDIPRLVVDAAAEIWMEPEILRRVRPDVILPPHVFEGRTEDNAFFAWHSAKMLEDMQIPFALSGHGSADVGSRLAVQPALAMRGGCSFEAALAAVTINPARIVGVDDRVGTIEVGKDADLVLWSGMPFQPTSRVVGVLLDGRLIVDPRSREED